ncbi:MAG: hypothetical protein EPO07_16610 [Verrucomicrobia bacterium]|nr:MAG: hypothetical protein EPO07_16610 [Verrucomicrobiota bacterium]
MSRRNKHCQYCGAELPEHLLFTKAEIEAQDRLRATEELEQKIREEARKEAERINPTEGLYFRGEFGDF